MSLEAGVYQGHLHKLAKLTKRDNFKTGGVLILENFTVETPPTVRETRNW